MPHLLELNLGGSGIMRELDPSIGHLKWLTHLKLSYCSLKELPPEVWQLTSLEEFDLSGCSELIALPLQKPFLLDKLKVLNLKGCRKLKICPEFTGMPHLEMLSFRGCGEMSVLHRSIGDLKWLTRLSLSECYSLKELPPEVWQLTSLEDFDLYGCSEITALPQQKQLLLDKLKVLKLNGCRKLKICPEFTNMPHLERLSFRNCREMSEVHPSIGCLKSLIDLDLRVCHSLNELPEQIWQLTALETIGVYDYYSKVRKRPTHLGDSVLLNQPFLGNKLKVLSLDGCKNISKSPDFMSMPYIKILDFSGCEKMSQLHPSIGHLKGLTELNLSGCKSLKKLPREIWQLTSLEEFRLSNCPQLTVFPSQLGHFRSLEQPLLDKFESSNLTGCENLTTCLDFKSTLKCLTTLDLSDCISLKELPEEVGQLTSLKTLGLSSCSQISTLPESMGHLKQLKRLYLSKCSSFKEVPKCFVSLDMLDYLTVSGCVQLKFLPQLPPSLTKLDATGCCQLKIIENVSNLERLCTLRLHDCERLVEVPGIDKLKCLETLDLGGCRNLGNSLWKIIQEANFKSLRTFSIPSSPIKASCLHSLSFLVPKQFMSGLLYLCVDERIHSCIASDESIESDEDKSLDSIPSDDEDRNLIFIPSDDEDINLNFIPRDDDEMPPIDSLLGRDVRIDITVEDAQDSFSTSVNKRDDGFRSYYRATFGRDSNLMMKARDGGFTGNHSNAAQRKSWMTMRVSIDGWILLDGDLSTSTSSSYFYVDKVGHNIVAVEFGLD